MRHFIYLRAQQLEMKTKSEINEAQSHCGILLWGNKWVGSTSICQLICLTPLHLPLLWLHTHTHTHAQCRTKNTSLKIQEKGVQNIIVHFWHIQRISHSHQRWRELICFLSSKSVSHQEVPLKANNNSSKTGVKCDASVLRFFNNSLKMKWMNDRTEKGEKQEFSIRW